VRVVPSIPYEDALTVMRNTIHSWILFLLGSGSLLGLAANVIGKRPPGSASPKINEAVPVPVSCPGYHVSRTALTFSSHGIATGVDVLRTTTVCGFCAATASINAS
jgi:hypothetical protein